MSSRLKSGDFILSLYKDRRSVLRLSDVAMLFPDVAPKNLSDRMSYYIETGRLRSPRKGIYVKPGYNPLELANVLYTPSYISLEYVLQQEGVIFQYDARLTSISYLSREVIIDEKKYSYRRIKEEIILNLNGITRHQENCNIATAERALLDMLYLDKRFYLDNLHPIDVSLIQQILPVYRSKTLEKRVKKLLEE